MNSWKWVIYIAISVSVAGVVFVAKFDNELGTNTFYSITTFFLCHIFVSQLFGEFFVEELRAELEALKRASERSNEELALSAKMQSGFHQLKNMDLIIGAAGQGTAEAIVKRMKIFPKEQKIELEGRDFAYLCYSKFWAALVKFQSTCEAPDKLVARMTHTSDVSSWVVEYMKFMSAQHQTFASRGGTAFRVLIDRRSRGVGDMSQYIGLIDKMGEDGVCVAYLNRYSKDFPESVLQADFCIVSDSSDSSEDTPRYALRWMLKGADVKGVTLTRSQEKFNTHKSEWDLLKQALTVADYSLDASDPDIARRLGAYRDLFLSRAQ
jgi:hypothetical protein